ncbi:MAG: hypothetical protein RBU37_04260 [Myxococcota bacterium]|nr:hypothetical protein [Myxococcota bacterium]
MSAKVCALIEDGWGPLQPALLAERLELQLSLASSVLQLMGMLESEPADLLLLPLGQNEEEVILLLRALRKRSEPLPWVVLVAQGGKLIEDEREAFEAGAHHWLEPSAFDEALVSALRAYQQSSDAIALGRVHSSEDTPIELFARQRRGRAGLSYLACLSKLEQARFADAYEVLGVEPDADGSQIDMAYVNLLRLFTHADEHLGKDDADELRSALDDAHLLLKLWRKPYTLALLHRRAR